MGQSPFEVKHVMVIDVVGCDDGTGQELGQELPQLAHVLPFRPVEKDEVPRTGQSPGQFRPVAVEGRDDRGIRRAPEEPAGQVVALTVKFNRRNRPARCQERRHLQGRIADAGADFQDPRRPARRHDAREQGKFAVAQDGQVLFPGTGFHFFKQGVHHGMCSWTFFMCSS